MGLDIFPVHPDTGVISVKTADVDFEKYPLFVLTAGVRDTGDLVALKKIRIRDVRALPTSALREMNALRLMEHPWAVQARPLAPPLADCATASLDDSEEKTRCCSKLAQIRATSRAPQQRAFGERHRRVLHHSGHTPVVQALTASRICELAHSLNPMSMLVLPRCTTPMLSFALQ